MYNIIRFYANGKKRVMQTGLTLEEAQKHCEDPKTQGVMRNGVKWFEGFTRG